MSRDVYSQTVWNPLRGTYTTRQQLLNDQADAAAAKTKAEAAQSALAEAKAKQELLWVGTQPPQSFGASSRSVSSGTAGDGYSSAPPQSPIMSSQAALDQMNVPSPEAAPIYEPPPPPPPVAPLVLPKHADATPEERAAASAAAYASAKDRASLTGRASLDALRNEMAANNLSGSGLEMAGVGNIISGAQAELGAAAREQSAADLARAQAVADDVYRAESGGATTTYQGNLSQRENDASRATAQAGTKYQGALTGRGQTINANEAKAANRRASLQSLAALRSGGVVY